MIFHTLLGTAHLLLNISCGIVPLFPFNDDLSGGMLDTKAHAFQFALQIRLCISSVEQQTKLCAASHADVGRDAARRASEEQPASFSTVNKLQGGHKNGDEDEESGQYMGREFVHPDTGRPGLNHGRGGAFCRNKEIRFRCNREILSIDFRDSVELA